MATNRKPWDPKIEVPSVELPPDVVEAKNEEIANQLVRIKQLRNTTISIGECKKCPLKMSCEHMNETDTECRAVLLATNVFYDEALKSPYIKDGDLLALRTLASQHGILHLCEMFFKAFGSLSMSQGKVKFNELMRTYTQIQPMYLKGLAEFGLTPRGRAVISGNKLGKPISAGRTALYDYIKAKKSNELPGSEGSDQHNRLLSGPPASQLPGDVGYPGSYTPGDLQSSNVADPEVPVESDAGGSGNSKE